MFSRGNTFDFPKTTVFRGVEVRICRQRYTDLNFKLLVC